MADETVIIGGGPAGLAVAAQLGQRGHAYRLLERADTLVAAWRGRYDSLQLHTVRWLSSLPGAPIPRRYGRWVRRDDLVAYLTEYARRNRIEPELGVDVVRIQRAPNGWRLETSAGSRTASRVVVATGYTRTPYVPEWPGRDSFPGSFRHAVSYREPSAYRGLRVLVVGAGNSAAEIAVDLVDVADEVQLSVRTPPNIVRRDVLGVPSQLIGVALRPVPEALMNPLTTLMRRVTVPDLSGYGLPAPTGDGFSQFLRSQTVPIIDHGFVQAVRAGRIRVVPAVASIEDRDVRLVDGRVVRPDAIVAATGYRPDLEAMLGDLGVLDASGQPLAHGATAVDGAPGLYFVGISVQLAGLLREIGREAQDVARHLQAA